MSKEWDFSALDDWMSDVVTEVPKFLPDEYDVERTYPYEADRVPKISYVELAWLGYYRVVPSGKKWDVVTADGVHFVDSDRRTAVRNAQAYCTALERSEDTFRHLPKPLRPLKHKPVTTGEPPF